MNRALDCNFHVGIQSSSQIVVNGLWNLCKAQSKSE
jgi:hypothetical protein